MDNLLRNVYALLESCELGCDLSIEDCGKPVERAGKCLKLLLGNSFPKIRKILRKSPIFPKLFSVIVACDHNPSQWPHPVVSRG